MIKNFQKFGEKLKNIRAKKEMSLREICKAVNYDPSNWSKIERGQLAPPSDEKVLDKWATALGIPKKSKEFQEFIYQAKIAQGIIPQDIMTRENLVNCLPAIFRTLRNEKPTKEEIDKLIEILKAS
ncbi:MAG: helix-turn-helix transcriptional regulator [bacterium]